MVDGCTCQECDNLFTIDLMVLDDLWEEIKPRGKPIGSGLLCPECIIRRICQLMEGKFMAAHLKFDE